jgi:N12 class adenine-specific DNA methylase
MPPANGQAPAPAPAPQAPPPAAPPPPEPGLRAAEGNANIYSSKLNAIMRLLMGAETDEEFAAARQMAAQIVQMSDDDARALLGGQEPGGGSFLRHLREDYPLQYAMKTKCQTSGAQFHIHTGPREVDCRVTMPFDLGLDEKEASLLEANLHNALELVLARYFVGGDEDDADRHFRADYPLQYEAPRVLGGYGGIGGQGGGTWILAESLARFYAGLFTDMEAAGRPPKEDEVSDALDEIGPHGWTLEHEGHTWEAVRLDEEEEALPHKRVKAGTPGAIELTDKRGHKYHVDKETARKLGVVPRRPAATAAGVMTRLAPHAVPIGGPSHAQTVRAWQALLKHHGPEAVGRLDELAGGAEEALAKTTDPALKTRLAQKLGALHAMARLAAEPAGEETVELAANAPLDVETGALSIDYGDLSRFGGALKTQSAKRDLAAFLQKATTLSDEDLDKLMKAQDTRSRLGFMQLKGLQHIAQVRAEARPAATVPEAPPAATAAPVPGATPVARAFTGLRDVAAELQAIREDMTSASPDPDLQQRVDAAGAWLAANAKPGGLGDKLLQEAHQLNDRLAGGSGKPGMRIQMPEPPAEEEIPVEAQPPVTKGDAVTVHLPHDYGTTRRGTVESVAGGLVHVRDQYGTLQSVTPGFVEGGFTGTTRDSLGREYHWIDGKRTKKGLFTDFRKVQLDPLAAYLYQHMGNEPLDTAKLMEKANIGGVGGWNSMRSVDENLERLEGRGLILKSDDGYRLNPEKSVDFEGKLVPFPWSPSVEAADPDRATKPEAVGVAEPARKPGPAALAGDLPTAFLGMTNPVATARLYGLPDDFWDDGRKVEQSTRGFGTAGLVGSVVVNDKYDPDDAVGKALAERQNLVRQGQYKFMHRQRADAAVKQALAAAAARAAGAKQPAAVKPVRGMQVLAAMAAREAAAAKAQSEAAALGEEEESGFEPTTEQTYAYSLKPWNLDKETFDAVGASKSLLVNIKRSPEKRAQFSEEARRLRFGEWVAVRDWRTGKESYGHPVGIYLAGSSTGGTGPEEDVQISYGGWGPRTPSVTSPKAIRPLSYDEVLDAARAAGQVIPEEAGVPAEARPAEPGFTGTTVDSLGREYHWVNGKRTKKAEEPAAAPPATAPEEEEHELEREGPAGPGRGLPAGERLGAPAGAAPPEVLPPAGPRAGGEPEAVPGGADLGRHGLRAGPGGAEHPAVLGPGAGAGEALAAPAGGPGEATDVGGTVGPGIPGGGGGGSAAVAREASLQEPATALNPTDVAAGNFRYVEGGDASPPGSKSKFWANIAALRVLEALKLEGRDTATPAEQLTLSKFSGWGQFKRAFDYNVPGGSYEEYQKWEKERQTLKGLLGEREYELARKSALNAHYTDPSVVKAQWDMARKLGFTGGKFLETSAGIGYYLGMMPPDLMAQTQATAVEMDPGPGKMLQLLYPKVTTKVQGFQDFQAPDNFYELVASNVPFAHEIGFYDPEYAKYQPALHDYFFLKSIDKVRPGGLVMHITSTGTLNKPDSPARQRMVEQSELVAAIRFPGGQHKESAGTEVVTDMLILRKKHPGEEPVDPDKTPPEAMPPAAQDAVERLRKMEELGRAMGRSPEDMRVGLDSIRDDIEKATAGFTGMTTDSLGRVYHWVNGKRVPGPRWDDVLTVPDPAGGKPIPTNRYFVEHPEQVLGTIDRSGHLHQPNEPGVTAAPDYEERLQAIIDRLPEGLLKRTGVPAGPAGSEALPAPGEVKEGGYTIVDGKLYQRERGALIPQEVSEKELALIQEHLEIRDVVRDSLNRQLAGESADEAREKLNAAYDAFVAEHGPLHNRANFRTFQDDPDAPVLLALEDEYDPKKKTATKADIFRKDTVRHVETPESAGTIAEAVGISLHTTGHLDVKEMARLLKKTPEETGELLAASGLAYNDPELGWKPAAEYLSGNVRRKLTLARAAAETDPKFQANVTALEAHQPKDLDSSRISAKLGAVWVPPDDIASFAAMLLEGQADKFAIKYIPQTGEWQADFSPNGEFLARGEQATTVWATDDVDFMKLFEAALNGSTVTVREPDPADSKKRIVNRRATDDAQAMVQKMRNAFKTWVWEDDERRQRLTRFYNDNFNNIVKMHYDGSHQTFPGLNPAIKLRSLQADFVWRVVTTGGGLAAHDVGTGKTLSMICAAMELRRLGLAKKPAICCLKSNIEQITAEARRAYPAARILSTEGMFDAKSRKKTIARMATGDYDMVIMTHDNLNMLQMKPEVQAKYIREEMADLVAAKARAEKDVAEAEASGGYGRRGRAEAAGRVVASIEKAMMNLQERLEKALDATRKDNAVFFEDTGIDTLMIDECFPGDTPVMTRAGEVPIREVVQGRLPGPVLTLNRATGGLEWRPVTAWFERPLRNHLVRVEHECGSFVCTCNHNVWTEEDGYVQAGRLLPSHTLRVLPQGHSFYPVEAVEGPAGADAVLRQAVSRPGADGQALHADLRVVRRAVHGAWQAPGEARAGAPALLWEGLCDQLAVVAVGADVPVAWWQGAEDGAPETALGGAGLAGHGAYHPHGAGQGAVPLPAQLLRRGRCLPGREGGGRNRREFSPHAEVAVPRQTQDGDPVRSRVVGVALHQRAGEERTFDGRSGDQVVYDFEVAGTHNYFASGVNVSNSHKYKSLPVYTKMQGLKGVPTSRSNRATSMLMRTRWLQEQHNGRGVVFATGTPITNTLAELYNLQRYLQPGELKERGIDNFDAWARSFAEVETKREFTVSGEYKPVTRLAAFSNVAELMQIAGQAIDFVATEDVKDAEGKPAITRPDRHDHVIAAPKSDAMMALMESLQARARSIKRFDPENPDNMLVICTDGRKGALDMRLVDPNAKDDPQSKTNLAIDNVLKLYKERPGKTQLIFSDVGVNPIEVGERTKTDADEPEEGEAPEDSTTMHWYGDVIDKLVARGIPREKIADFSKLKGQAKIDAQLGLQRGEIAVAIGSTDKLGTGVNVQRQVTAMHHLDCPYVPASVEQRDGRGWRNQNQNKDIDIYRYVTKGSLDQTFWGIISRKARFLKQAREENVREIREEDTEQLSPEQIQAVASDNPRFVEKVELDDEVQKLINDRGRHEREQDRFIRRLAGLKRDIEGGELRTPRVKEAIQVLTDHPDFSFTIGQVKGVDEKTFGPGQRKEAGEAFQQWQKDNSRLIGRNNAVQIGSYRGLDLWVDNSHFFLTRPGLHTWDLAGERVDVSDSLNSIEAVIRRVPQRLAEHEAQVAGWKADREKLEGQVGKTWNRGEELKTKQARLVQLEAELSNKKPIQGKDLEDFVLDLASRPGGVGPRDVMRLMEEKNLSADWSAVQQTVGDLLEQGKIRQEGNRAVATQPRVGEPEAGPGPAEEVGVPELRVPEPAVEPERPVSRLEEGIRAEEETVERTVLAAVEAGGRAGVDGPRVREFLRARGMGHIPWPDIVGTLIRMKSEGKISGEGGRAYPVQHRRGGVPRVLYARLAERARRAGDPYSAAIYARQARGEW